MMIAPTIGKIVVPSELNACAKVSRLDAVCGFGCAQADELRAWIDGKHRSAS